MDRLRGGHERPQQRLAAVAVDMHALGDHRARVPPADRLEAQKAFVVNELDQKADLVGVRGQHDARPAGSFFDGDDIAERVHPDFVG